jgi:3-deoxy-alpha-D-manno-octulosonate 8-oxidase
LNNSKNVENYIFGKGAIAQLPKLLEKKLEAKTDFAVYFIDEFFREKMQILDLKFRNNDEVYFVETVDEPKTEDIDNFRDKILELEKGLPKVIVGIGGGITLDTGKAVSNLLTNGGKAEDYQGWDLVKVAGVYKIGIPTISGTGAEASRTCVMTNSKNGLKLGMNSDFTIYNQLILDPNLTKTVPKEQYFYTGMDTYIHCVESLNGNYRNAIGDAYSRQAIELTREVFHSEDMMSEDNREKLMVASYLGGCAIANSFVGVIHPFSAGLSVVLGTHHCVGNCITMNGMEEFYPDEYHEFVEMAKKQGIEIPKGIAKDLIKETYEQLFHSTTIHEKPLKNALGENFKEILTLQKVEEIFKKM